MTLDKNRILIELSESDRTAFLRVPFPRRSFPQQVFSAIWLLEPKVNNGGFSQWFLNSSRETAGFATKALDTIGATLTADICRRAIDTAFPGGLPPSHDAVRSAAADFSAEIEDRLNALDQEFFTYPNDLTELLFGYVCKRPEEFGEVPKPNDG